MENEYAHIALSQGKETIVDWCDYENLSERKWTAWRVGTRWYAVRSIKRSSLPDDRMLELMHRVIMGNPAGLVIDHINGNGLDNRRSNLRIATYSQNIANSHKPVRSKSGFKGVHKFRKAWIASIRKDGVQRHLGVFDNPRDAARAFDEAALFLHGEFAKTNQMMGLL